MLILYDQVLSKGTQQSFPFTNQASSKNGGRKIISFRFAELSNSTYTAAAKFNLLSNYQNVISFRGNFNSTDIKDIGIGKNVTTVKSNESSAGINVISEMQNVISAEANVIPTEANVISVEPNVISTEPNVISAEANVNPGAVNVISAEANVISRAANVISAEANVISMRANVFISAQKSTFTTNSKKNDIHLWNSKRKILISHLLQLKSEKDSTKG